MHRPPFWHVSAGPVPLKLGTFCVGLAGREIRFQGLVRVRDPDAFAKWARQHLVLATGTTPRRWLGTTLGRDAAPEWNRTSGRQLRRLGERLASPAFSPGEATRINDFPGLYATDLGCREFDRVETPEGQMLARLAQDGVEVRWVQKVRTTSADKVPVAHRLRASRQGCISFYEGQSFGLCEQLDGVPQDLRARLDHLGTAFEPDSAPMTPLTDLHPRFLLKVPSMRAVHDAGGPATEPPSCADAPAVMFRSTDPVPLLDSDGDLLPVPIVSDPAAAAAVLVRCPEQHVYVPTTPPLDYRDLRPKRGEWLVGTDIFGRAR